MLKLLKEAREMPDASVSFARGISQVWTPEHLVPLRDRVRKDHLADLRALHSEINDRFGTTGATNDYINVFYAASEMALMERIGHRELAAADRQRLRHLWEALLRAT